MSTLLIDGDGFGFTGFDFKTGTQDLANAKSTILKTLHNFVMSSNCNDFAIFIGGKGNWRNEIYPQYKANRTGPKPPERNSIMQWLRDEFNAYSLDNYEADDVIAHVKRAEPNSIVCSNDKDVIYGLPGVHMKSRYGEFEWIDNSVYNSSLFNYAQMLMGDKTDNIPTAIVKAWVKGMYPGANYRVGLGYGQKTAEHVIRQADIKGHNRWDVCSQILNECGIDPAIQKDLIRLGVKKEHSNEINFTRNNAHYFYNK